MTTKVIDLCGQALCTSEAAYSFVWPGRSRAFICAGHYSKLVKIAEALGLGLDSLDVVELSAPRALL